MPRTDATKVQDLLGGDYESGRSLTRFISWANLVVNKVASCAIAKGDAQADEVLEEMETWLAAHAYQQSDQGYASSSTEGSSASFQGQTGMRIESTKYGQSALGLDFSGCLQRINAGPSKSAAGMVWLGKNPPSQVDYEQRS